MSGHNEEDCVNCSSPRTSEAISESSMNSASSEQRRCPTCSDPDGAKCPLHDDLRSADPVPMTSSACEAAFAERVPAESAFGNRCPERHVHVNAGHAADCSRRVSAEDPLCPAGCGAAIHNYLCEPMQRSADAPKPTLEKVKAKVQEALAFLVEWSDVAHGDDCPARLCETEECDCPVVEDPTGTGEREAAHNTDALCDCTVGAITKAIECLRFSFDGEDLPPMPSVCTSPGCEGFVNCMNCGWIATVNEEVERRLAAMQRRERAPNWPTSDEGDTHTRLTRIVDENLSYRPTASIASLLTDLEKELPELKARAERAEAALEYAIALAEEGWSYASRVFVDKWKAEERTAELRKLADVTDDEPLPTAWAMHIIEKVREAADSSRTGDAHGAKDPSDG